MTSIPVRNYANLVVLSRILLPCPRTRPWRLSVSEIFCFYHCTVDLQQVGALILLINLLMIVMNSHWSCILVYIGVVTISPSGVSPVLLWRSAGVDVYHNRRLSGVEIFSDSWKFWLYVANQNSLKKLSWTYGNWSCEKLTSDLVRIDFVRIDLVALNQMKPYVISGL